MSVCVCVCAREHVWISKHVSHYKLKSLTGDFVYLILIKPPPLPTWKPDRYFEKKKKKIPSFNYIQTSLQGLWSSGQKMKKNKKEEKKTQNRFVKTVPALMAHTTQQFYSHSKINSKMGIPLEYWAHMVSIMIPWNSAQSKVVNKENIPLIWGLPQAGCEGNLGGSPF